MKCSKCGIEYEGNFCPNGCNSPQFNNTQQVPKKKKKAGKIVLTVLLIFVALVIVAAIFVEDENPENVNSNTSTTSSVVKEETKKEQKKSDTVIYSDDDIKVKFIKVEDAADTVGVTACYIYLDVENTGSQKYTVSLTEAYANDTQITMMSGLPMTLEPGKSSKNPFMFGYNNILTSADDVEKLEFKIVLLNDEMNDIIKTTKTITVKVK